MINRDNIFSAINASLEISGDDGADGRSVVKHLESLVQPIENSSFKDMTWLNALFDIFIEDFTEADSEQTRHSCFQAFCLGALIATDSYNFWRHSWEQHKKAKHRESTQLTSDNEIRDAMQNHNDNVTKAAEALDMTRQALHKRLKEDPFLRSNIEWNELFGE